METLINNTNNMTMNAIDLSNPMKFESINCKVYHSENTNDWMDDLWIVKTHRGSYDPSTRFMEGLIFNSKGDIFYVGLTTLQEYTNQEYVRIEELIDGTKIGLYYKDNDWRFSTNHMINADSAHWFDAEYSFGKMVRECLIDYDFSKLNKDYSYTFIIRHPKNIIVNKVEKPEIYHVCTRDNRSLEEIHEDIGIQRPKVLEGPPEELIKTNLGLILVDESGNRYKMESEKFKEIRDIQGNSPNRVFNYLCIRNNPVMKEKLMEYFPELKEMIDETETKIKIISDRIHYEYCGKHILKNNKPINPRFIKVINSIHINHREKHMPTKKEDVYNFVSNSDPERIMFLINTKI